VNEFLTRTVIFGNGGSGKSTLAGALARVTGVPPVDLDRFHWEDEGYGRKRDEEAAKRLTLAEAVKPRWIIEGVYGWLADVVLPRATALLWLDLPWAECRAGLLARGPRRGADAGAFAELLAWSEAYWTRATSSSLSGHAARFEAFAGAKRRLTSRSAVAEFTTALTGAL